MLTLALVCATVSLLLVCLGAMFWLVITDDLGLRPDQPDTEPLSILARIEAYSDEPWGSQHTLSRRYSP